MVFLRKYGGTLSGTKRERATTIGGKVLMEVYVLLIRKCQQRYMFSLSWRCTYTFVAEEGKLSRMISWETARKFLAVIVAALLGGNSSLPNSSPKTWCHAVSNNECPVSHYQSGRMLSNLAGLALVVAVECGWRP